MAEGRNKRFIWSLVSFLLGALSGAGGQKAMGDQTIAITGRGPDNLVTIDASPPFADPVLWCTVRPSSIDGATPTLSVTTWDGFNEGSQYQFVPNPTGPFAATVSGRRILDQHNYPPHRTTVNVQYDLAGLPAAFIIAVASPIYPHPADFNLDGAVTPQDIYDFLAAYTAGDLSTDLDGTGTITVEDLFKFLRLYFGDF